MCKQSGLFDWLLSNHNFKQLDAVMSYYRHSFRYHLIGARALLLQQQRDSQSDNRGRKGDGEVGESIQWLHLESIYLHVWCNPETTLSWEPISAALIRDLKWIRGG
jgi:hypothetical protein